MLVSEVSSVLDIIGFVANDKAVISSCPSYIAVFGGKLSASDMEPISQRDEFIKYVGKNHPDLKDKLVTPESYDDWNSFDTYSDLLEFETDLGFLTGAVIIFLEAPGSIAELGSFSQIESLKQKLVVVVSEERHPKKSFISLGPLRQLHASDSLSVCVIPKHQNDLVNQDMVAVVGQLRERLSSGFRAAKIKSNERQHQIILVLDLISIFEVVTIKELVDLAKAFGFDCTLKSLRQILYTLEQVGLISCRHYSSIDYYLPKKSANPWINYKSNDSAKPFHRSRIQSAARKRISLRHNFKRVWEIQNSRELFS